MNSFKKNLYSDQVAQVYKHMPESAAGNVANAFILTFILWKVVNHTSLFTWFSCLIGITILRFIVYQRFKKATIPNPQLWGNLFAIGLAISGLVWGLAGILLFPAQSTPHQFFIALVLAGLVAGAAASSSAILRAFYPYCILMLAPITIIFFGFGDEVHMGMGIVAIFFSVFAMITSYHIHLIIRSSIILRYENVQEIIDRKKAEQELKSYQLQLEEIVQERTINLATVNKELENKIKEIQEANTLIVESEERLKLALQSADQGLYDLNLETGEAVVSPEYALMLDYDPDEFVETNQKWRERLHPDDHDKIGSYYEAYVNGKNDIYQTEFRQRTKKGDWKWILSNGKIVEKDASGKPVRMLGTHTDITRLKNAEMALRQSEKRFRTLIETVPFGIQESDLNGIITFSNKANQEIFGYTEKEMIGKSMSAMIPTEPEIQHFRDYLKTLVKDQPIPVPFFTKNITKSGKEIDVQVDWNYKRDEYGSLTGFISVISDITEKKKAEEEQIKTQKLESLGVLAGGIAHDFNNILTAIIGNLSLAKRETKSTNKIYELLSETEKASLRAKGLTKQLLTFSKGGAPVSEIIPIDILINDSARFMLSGSKVSLQLNIPDDLWPVEVDSGQISQVIQNIVSNANEAMPEGGSITISVEKLKLEATNNLNLTPGNYVNITIEDQGLGIPQKNKDKIFDPYFTTKQQGRGLGLSVCHSIIQKHHGTITFDSVVGAGSTFNIFLPASDKKVLNNQNEKALTGSGKILLMDDEEMVRDVTLKILNRLGYEVELAEDGTKAITLYTKAQEEGKPFTAVIMDLTIPGGMGGEETIKKLLDIDPGIKAFVSSGYADNPVMANYKQYGFVGALPKPYSINSLSNTLMLVSHRMPIPKTNSQATKKY